MLETDMLDGIVHQTGSSISILLFVAVTSLNAYASNPSSGSVSDGIVGQRHICDPGSLLSRTYYIRVSRKLDEFSAVSKCGHCPAVYLTAESDVTATSHSIFPNIRSPWHKLCNRQLFLESCRIVTLLVIDVHQRQSKLWHCYKRSSCRFMFNVPGNEWDDNSKGYSQLIERYIAYLAKQNERYRRQEDCEILQNLDRDNTDITGQVRWLLPSPSLSPSACKLSWGDFVCDPHEVLSEDDRDEVAALLNEVNGHIKCGTCIFAALINTPTAPTKLLRKMASILINKDWIYEQCTAKLLLFIHTSQHKIILEGTKSTMFCSQLNRFIEQPKSYNSSGDLYDVVNRMVESYYGEVVIADDCEIDTCGKPGIPRRHNFSRRQKCFHTQRQFFYSKGSRNLVMERLMVLIFVVSYGACVALF